MWLLSYSILCVKDNLGPQNNVIKINLAIVKFENFG